MKIDPSLSLGTGGNDVIKYNQAETEIYARSNQEERANKPKTLCQK